MSRTSETPLHDSPENESERPRGARLTILTIATATGMLLAALDSNITATAMPTVVAALGGLDLYSWVFAGYALASTTAMPLFGRLSDIYGRKRLYLGGMVLFVLASATCAAANSMPVLIAGRAVQGIGGAAILGLTFTIIADLYPPERRGQVQGVTSSAWAISAIIGPAIGAFLVTTLGWRWVFLVNLPVSVIPIFLLSRLLHDRRRPAGQRSVDFLGAFTLSASVICLMVAALLAGNDGRLLTPTIGALTVGCLVLLGVFIAIQRKVPAPTIPLDLFRGRMFLMGTIGSIVFGWVGFSIGVFVPLFAQGVTGGTALQAGAVLLPNSLGWSAAAAISGPLVRPLGYRRMSLLGFGLLLVSVAMLARMNQQSSLTEMAIAMTIAGLACGVLSPTLLLAIQNTVDPNQLGVATGLAMFLRNIGYSVGVSVMGAVLAGGLVVNLGSAIADPGALLTSGDTSTIDPAVITQFRAALAAAMHDVFLLFLIASVLGIVAALGMTGWHDARKSAPATETPSPVA
ncbi:MAG TPA: MDR family MFS transporter [Chloroflexota bacterium]|nr:MDR family MFS transporter [Chloroflexota bacterium]